MARIIDTNHADGWQNKKASEKVVDNMHRLAQEQASVNNTTANRSLEAVVQSRNADAPHAPTVPSQDAARTHAPVESRTSHQQTQSARPEVQTEGARVQAQEQYQKLKGEAKVLENLSRSRAAQPQESVPQTTQATQAQVSQNQQNATTFTLAQAMNRATQPQRAQADATSRNVDPRRLATDDPNRARQGAERPDTQKLSEQGQAATAEGVQVTTQAAQASITQNRDGERSDTARREEGDTPRPTTGRRGPQGARSGVYRTGAGSTTDDMNRVYGGESSFSGGTDSDGEQGSSEVSAAGTIPTEDSLVVFNEFDSEQPGLETVLAKRNILERHVIKSVVEQRLMEIRDVDVQAGARIHDAFAVLPLTDRIVGDIEVDLGNFYKGLYNGGLIG